jgi:hypothetical protein
MNKFFNKNEEQAYLFSSQKHPTHFDIYFFNR